MSYLEKACMVYNVAMKKDFLERNKKLLVLVLCSICLARPVFAQSVDGLFQKGVEEYRKGNSQECAEIMRTLEKKDPSNAYVEYYLAMSEAKLGHLNEAKDKYEQVILLNQDEQLVSYSKEGIKNIEKVQGKDDVAVVKDKKTSKIIDKPALKPESELKKAQKNSVSDDEIAKAIKVLREAGLLNVQVGVNGNSPTSAPAVDPEIMKQNAEMMQMNMMMSSMGGGSKNSSMDMLPLLMMQQQQGNNGGKSAMSPEIIQMMMNNTMLEGLNGLDSNDKDK
jgi:tetratricopeptide (TPR) repeat protein